MRITIITSPFATIPPNAIGAVERLWYDISKVLSKNGQSLSFISKKFDLNDTNGMNSDGIDVKYINGFPAKRHIALSLFLDLVYSIKALAKLSPTDILVMNTFWTPILCPLFKKKFKVSVYNVARSPKGQFKYYKHVDRLACVSSAVEQTLLKQTPQAKKQVKVINNPINTDVFCYSPRKSDDNAIKIAYSGRVHPEKGLDILVKAFRILIEEHPNLHLSIIGARDIGRGGGGQEYINYLLSLSEGVPIHFIDPIYDQAQLHNELSQHDIYCYPSVSENGETFGVAPLEAMATGVATIVSALDCFKDFVIDGENALVFDHRRENPAISLSQKIRELIVDEKLRERLGKNGAQIAMDNFNTDKIANEYLNDFKNLTGLKCPA